MTRRILTDENLIAVEAANGELVYVKGDFNAMNVRIIDGASSSGSLGTFTERIFTPVTTGDIGTSGYVSGSLYNIKSIKEYETDAVAGSYAVITTFEYGLAADANFVTKETTRASTV